MIARSPLSPPDLGRGAPYAPVGAPGAVLAELAALLARGALRAVLAREQKGLALLAESPPSCVRAANNRRPPSARRDGD
jgi:hypothetical protein